MLAATTLAAAALAAFVKCKHMLAAMVADKTCCCRTLKLYILTIVYVATRTHNP